MIKTLSQALRMDKERFKVPKSVQQAIPIQRIWPDGIFQQGTKFSKTYRFIIMIWNRRENTSQRTESRSDNLHKPIHSVNWGLPKSGSFV